MTFIEWLETATKKDESKLSKRTVERYSSGLRIISKEMVESGVIGKPLEEMELHELDLAISIIFNTESFIIKNTTGKGMYSNALKRYRLYKFQNTDRATQEIVEEAIVINDIKLTADEKETIVKARRGQGLYRELLMKKYNGECIITGINIKQVLIASHIKPWVVCDNFERVDVNNGLLLSATYDRLFDSGLITFDFNGKLIISSLINNDNTKKLNIIKGSKYKIGYCPEMKKYIEYHNKYIFIDN